eukprot:TRINITY_DN337_c0_g1_i2.p1 TRINITY_DN337_c0_g1~~TRINITY_DN337_c0_g1_i2.p1  ORF type:complete len:518 (-),score=95.07 TRINITY_DN337_c0_g1_i2:87-1499(-)
MAARPLRCRSSTLRDHWRLGCQRRRRSVLAAGAAGAVAALAAILAPAGAAAATLAEVRSASGQSFLVESMLLRKEQHLNDDSRAQLPDTAEDVPLFACPRPGSKSADGAGAGEAEASWREAVTGLCRSKETRNLLEVHLDKRFRKHYETAYGLVPGAWVPEAYVNYVRVSGPGTYYGKLTEALVDSIHRFSQRPVVVVNFGSVAPPELDPNRFPRLILLHAREVPQRVSFNFNKFLAILLARAKVGISVDSDMMVGPHADKLFARTQQEVTAAYRFPMLPTHYLDRDPAHSGYHRNNFLSYDLPGSPKVTMRWGQAQPTWTHWALPFVGRWLEAKLAGATLHNVPTADVGEDEDLLNVALWAENATKAWCMFQMMGVSWVWENFLPQHPPGPAPFYDDPVRYPNGVPVAFYMSHGEHNVSKVYDAMALLQKAGAHAQELKTIHHRGKFFSTFGELLADSENAAAPPRCIM